MTSEEKRLQVRNKYRTIIGRNLYSQDLRDYCYRPYKNGKYYSDCSGSISHTYKECGYSFGILNTVGMYRSTKLTEVPVNIVKGQITNPEVLRIGDMLLYAGNDSSRSYAGYVGHVEMVGEINGSKYILYGHGSGYPKKTEMVSKNRSRYNTKASTKLGNRGLIKAVRFIQDDGSENSGTDTVAALKKKDNTSEDAIHTLVAISKGNCYVRDQPDTTGEKMGVVYKGTSFTYAGESTENGWHSIIYKDKKAWVSGKYTELR